MTDPSPRDTPGPFKRPGLRDNPAPILSDDAGLRLAIVHQSPEET
jgi:hypothetical protein